MKVVDLLALFGQAGKRVHLIGTPDAGVLVALDIEGRLFTLLEGEVLNRVNPEAILHESTTAHYHNPGGDGLWPAPEGTSVGYQYATGSWRVPPGLRGARYQVRSAAAGKAVVEAEVDLVNNTGRGIPTLFRREIAVTAGSASFTRGFASVDIEVRESITYLGRRPLLLKDGLLAPWTLCQFDCGPGSEAVFPCMQKEWVWNLYDAPGTELLEWSGGLCRAHTDGTARYQIAAGEGVPWLEYNDPRRGLVVRRVAAELPDGYSYIDIRDAGPDEAPSGHGVRYSVYSDTDRFMEIEAAGGCPPVLQPGTALQLKVHTQFIKKA